MSLMPTPTEKLARARSDLRLGLGVVLGNRLLVMAVEALTPARLADRIGADILKRMGFGAVRLMTNNPKKLDMMAACGLHVVERVALHVGKTDQNAAYLATKATKPGQLL